MLTVTPRVALYRESGNGKQGRERNGKVEWGKVLLVGCLTSQQHTSVSQGRICSDTVTCCHTEIEVADQTFHLTQSSYTDTGPTSPNTDPITPGAWQGGRPLECQFLSHWYDSTPEKSRRKRDSNPGSSALEVVSKGWVQTHGTMGYEDRSMVKWGT